MAESMASGNRQLKVTGHSSNCLPPPPSRLATSICFKLQQHVCGKFDVIMSTPRAVCRVLRLSGEKLNL